GHGERRLARRQLARARGVGTVWHRVRRPSGSAAAAHAGGLGRVSVAEGLSGPDQVGAAHNRGAAGHRGRVPREPDEGPVVARSSLMSDIRTETMTVNMGPQHPSTHGVLRLVLELDGEVIQSVIPTIGYLHTGIEKTAEQKKWQQVIPLLGRMDYLGSQRHSLSYALSVEKLLGLEMPQRVKDIRVLLAELQRIASHLVWIGTHAMGIGAVSMLFYAIRERELLLNINELVAGFRFFPSYFRVGGLREDLPRGFHEAVNAFLDRFPGKIDEFEALLTKNAMFNRRTQGVGVITQE